MYSRRSGSPASMSSAYGGRLSSSSPASSWRPWSRVSLAASAASARFTPAASSIASWLSRTGVAWASPGVLFWHALRYLSAHRLFHCRERVQLQCPTVVSSARRPTTHRRRHGYKRADANDSFNTLGIDISASIQVHVHRDPGQWQRLLSLRTQGTSLDFVFGASSVTQQLPETLPVLRCPNRYADLGPISFVLNVAHDCSR